MPHWPERNGDAVPDDDLRAAFADGFGTSEPDPPPHPLDGRSERSLVRNGDGTDDAPHPAERTATFRLTRLSSVSPEPVEWVWPGRIALAKINMVDGLPDIGKSTIVIDICARATTGDEMPDHSRGLLFGRPSRVIMFTAEDGLGDTVRPRFDAAGGDPDMVDVVTATIVQAGARAEERWPNLNQDLDALEGAVRATGARIVVVDVLMAYLGADVNSHRDQDVRRVLSPLAAMAERASCAIVCLRHPTKGGSSVALLTGGGSIGIIGAARVGLLAGYDPDDETDDLNARRRLLAVAKCNIAAKAPTMAYRLEQYPGDLMAHVVWEGETTHRAEDLSAPPERHREDSEEHGNVDLSAKALVADLLEPGPMLVADITEYLKENGVDKRTALRHLHRLGGATLKLSSEVGDAGARGWAWTLTPPLTDGQEAALAERYDRLHAKATDRRGHKLPKASHVGDMTPSGKSVTFGAPDSVPRALLGMAAPSDSEQGTDP